MSDLLSDPFAVAFVTGMSINFASSLSEKIFSRWVGDPLQGLDARMGGPLKKLKILPETFKDGLQRCIKQGIEIYFQDHPLYAIYGVQRFLENNEVQNQIAGYFVGIKITDPLIISNALDDSFHLSAVDRVLAQRRGIDLEKILPDFLEACEKALSRNLNEPSILLVFTSFTQARNTQETVKAESQRVIDHMDRYFDEFEARQSGTPINEMFQYTGWAEVITIEAEETVVDLRKALNAGNLEQVNYELSKLKEPKRWSGIGETTKARILAFEANLALQLENNPEKAHLLLTEAAQLAELDEIYVMRSLLIYRSDSADAALEYLQNRQDIRSINITLSVLLGSQRFADANNLVNTIAQPNAETYRLMALLHLTQRNLIEAQASIHRAVELENEWLSIRFVNAVINYWSALSIEALPPYLVAWPEPVDSALVKRDADSIQSLKQAQEEFYKLIQFSETPWVQEPSAWYLASLAIDPDQQEKAKVYCQDLLSEDPLYIPAIVWNILRGYGIDLNTSIEKLEESITKDNTKLPTILTLLDCYTVQSEYDKALDILAQTESVFKQVDETLWHFRKMHIYLVKKDLDALTTTFNSAALPGAEKDRLRELLLFGYAVNRGDWHPLADHCERRYKETQEPYQLFKSCEAMYRAENWNYIVERSGELLDAFYTYESSRMVIDALAQAGQYEGCMRLIDRHIQHFSNLKFNPSLEQLQIHCLDQLGHGDDAVRRADTLASQYPNEINLINLAVLHHKYGNRDELITVGTKLRDFASVTPEAILFVAELVSLESEILAIELWEKLDHNTIPDELVPPTLLLGLRLGLDSRTSRLFPRMQILAAEKRAGVFSGDLAYLVEEIQKRSQFSNEQWTEYLHGKIPIHVLADFSLITLFEAYYLNLKTNINQSKPLDQFILMARHGSRPILSATPDDIANIHLQIDITSLLLSDFLGILDAVERVFRTRLYIPASIHEMLTLMETRLVPNNPERIKAAKQISYMLKTNSRNLQIADNLPESQETLTHLLSEIGERQSRLYDFAVKQSGYVVDFLPLRKPGIDQELADIPEEVKSRFLSRRAIVDILRAKGYLNQNKYNDVYPLVAGEPTIPGDDLEAITRYTVLICDLGLAINLFELGVLEAACKFFVIYITKEEQQEIQMLIETDHQYRSHRERIKNLNNRLNRGRKRGDYHLILLQQKHSDLDPNTRSLASILDNTSQIEGLQLKWIDDRYISSVPYHDSNIIGINEVLKFLLVATEITETEYYGYLHQLRKSNVRYIPIEVSELTHHLDNARIQDGNLDSREELIVLKRYISACMVKHEYLQRPPQKNLPNLHGEAFFFSQIMRLFTDTVMHIWQSDRNIEKCVAYSSWLFSNVFFDYPALINQDVEAAQYIRSFHLIIANMMLFSFNSLEKTAAFRRWLQLRILDIRAKNDPDFSTGIGEQIRYFFRDVRKELLEQKPDQDIEVLIGLQRLYFNLPVVIQEALKTDPQFLEELGFTVGSFINVDGYEFAEDDFRQALYKAINSGEAELISISEDSVKLKYPVDNNRISIQFEGGNAQVPVNLKILMPEVLLDHLEARLQAVKSQKQLFDCREAEFRELLTKIETQDALTRMKIVEALWQKSASRYYSELAAYVHHNRSLSWEQLLPPSAEGVLRYVRITSDSSPNFPETVSESANELLEGVGLVNTFIRLSSLPIEMPGEVYDHFKTLDSNELNTAIRHLMHANSSPMSKLHFIRLLLALSNRRSSYRRLAYRVTHSVLSESGLQDLAAYFVVLNWVNRVKDRIPGYQSYSAQNKLLITWIHAHHILSILGSRFSYQELVNIFSNADLQLSAYEQYLQSKDHWLDVSFPYRIDGISFIVMGLAYAFGNDLRETNNFRGELKEGAFVQEQDYIFPRRSLLLASTQMTNMLYSFLGGDRGLATLNLFDEELSLLFSEEALRSLVKSTIENLTQEPCDVHSWIILQSVFSDLPVYPDLKDDVVGLLSSLNYENILQQNAEAWWALMQFAIPQIKHEADSVQTERLANVLLEATPVLANTPFETTEEEANAASALINLVFHLCVTGYAPDHQIDKMVQTLSSISQRWPATAIHIENLTSYLYEIVSIKQSDSLVPLIARLRAIT